MAVLLVSANSQNELEGLVQEKPEGIIVGMKLFALRQNVWLEDQDLEALVQTLHKKDIKLYINALKMVMEPELEAMEQALKFWKEAGVDGIYIADEGWIQAARALDAQSLLIYQPETLAVNHRDVQFYINQGLQAVSLAHELSLQEILKIASFTKGLEVLIQGRYSWMYSARPLVSNYLDEIQRQKPGDEPYFWLQEATREGYMPVIEDETGTHIFSDTPLQSVNQIQALRQAGIERFRIDTLFEDEDYGVRQLRLYRNILEGLPAKEKDIAGSDSLYAMETTVKKEEAGRGKN